MEQWQVAATAAVVGALTSLFISIWGVTRNIRHKSVIEERQRWRDSLHDLVPALVSEEDELSRARIRDSIVLRMNPYKDDAAIQLMDAFVSEPSRKRGQAVVALFQDMLKRDWEKAKIEGSFWPQNATIRADRIVENQRRMASRQQLAMMEDQ